MGRAPCCDKANMKKGPWSPEEDAKLKAYMDKNGAGGNWLALPHKIGMKRCGKSCRLRWLNYLRPNIKHGGFTEEEDNTICSLYISIGTRWSIIAAQLPGRTDNDIKNYWNTKLKKKLLGRFKQSNQNPKDMNQIEDNSYSNALSNSSLERLQLHMQLQSPFSFYNNPTLCPKLHPFQEKMTQRTMSGSFNPMVQNDLPSPHTKQEKDEFYKPTSPGDALQEDGSKVNLVENYYNYSSVLINASWNNPMNSSFVPKKEEGEKNNEGIQQVCALQDELDDILNDKTMGYKSHEDQISEFDCFREMNSSNDNLIWWYNDFEAKSSASSNSWGFINGSNSSV
ncbi:hypothetical protein TanjilG_02925 [Lupinus angustifolius]|uniref:Uncharacterized protein n=1 Tax=Lupinus angustifolius TaxID=3871 RepID=A0A1J7GSE4_LUPAN|nr:PREDICTED: transcription factor MYB36-like [Lupinus angustifolius]OIV97217.1 hypothetical protein TanjilG_02925 [Lupinus angustifolius]